MINMLVYVICCDISYKRLILNAKTFTKRHRYTVESKSQPVCGNVSSPSQMLLDTMLALAVDGVEEITAMYTRLSPQASCSLIPSCVGVYVYTILARIAAKWACIIYRASCGFHSSRAPAFLSMPSVFASLIPRVLLAARFRIIDPLLCTFSRRHVVYNPVTYVSLCDEACGL